MAMGFGMGQMAGLGAMAPMSHGLPGHAMLGGGGTCVLHNNLNNISPYEDVLPAKNSHFTTDLPVSVRRHLTDV